MAKQNDQTGPSATASASTIHAGSTDTTRAPGFTSPDTSSAGGDTAAAPAAAAPAIPAAAPEPAPVVAPGVLAAQQAGPHSQNGLSGGLFGIVSNPILGGLFKKNASPIQDISAALAAGIPVSDASWAKAGYGPNGSALPSTPTVQPSPVGRTGLSGITTGVPGSMSGGAQTMIPMAANAVAPAFSSGARSAAGGVAMMAACFVAGTRILMADGTWKAVEQLRLHDVVKLGGEVIAHGIALTDDLMSYGGEKMSGSHVIFNHVDTEWSRAAQLGRLVDIDKPAQVFPVVTRHHLLVTREFVSADFAEIDHGQNYNEDQRLVMLNADRARNVRIRRFMDELRTRETADALDD